MRLIPLSICVALTLGLLASCSTSPSQKSVESSVASQKDKDKEKEKAKTSAAPKSGAEARLMDQANQYARDGLYREALQSFGEYLDKNPNDAAAHRTVGIIYVKTGVYKKALQHLNKAFEVYPNNFELNFYLGEAMRMQNRYADGIYHYKRALEVDPKNTNTLKALAWSYYNIRYYSEAIRTARQLRTLAPNDFQVSIILARVLNKTDMN
ncbi:MAG: tetratricopeptide repeat protein, partial [Proteobacteria bacterium]